MLLINELSNNNNNDNNNNNNNNNKNNNNNNKAPKSCHCWDGRWDELLIPKKCPIRHGQYIASDSKVQFLAFTRWSCFHLWKWAKDEICRLQITSALGRISS